ncbi:MAG: restriction endonuclease subunit S [Anaerolineales bacterium]|nr:restriction endonuclease subunit S [Anaerolineales bacterium]
MTITKRTLPKSWHWAKLEDVCALVGNSINPQSNKEEIFAHYSIPSFDDGRKPVIENGNNILSNKVVFDNGVVLFSKLNPRISRVWYVNDEQAYKRICSTEFLPLAPNLDQLDPMFLTWILQEANLITALRAKTAAATKSRERLKPNIVLSTQIPLPPLDEQKRIAARLNEQMSIITLARQAIDDQFSLLTSLVNSYFRESLQRITTKMHLSDCMVEVKKGVGETWAQYPVLGATRAGVAPAKEKVGKQPQRYKLVEPGTIFYNPMRIMIGSIAMLDDGDESGITSPDYVVLKGKEGILHARWFYYWFRSPYGENFIKSLARGAVRERMLFNRLDKGEIELPDWDTQVKIAEKLKEIKTFKQALESQLAEINELPSALLRQAFAGELS